MAWLLLIVLPHFTYVHQEWTPPGTIEVGQYLIDKTEATNLNWLEYLYYMEKEHDSLSYQQFLPEAINTWYELKENRHMPVSYLSYEQVVGYCKWRSKVVSEKFNKKVTYRLPSPDEWSEIAEILFKKNTKKIRKFHQQHSETLTGNEGNLIFFKIDQRLEKPQYFFSNVSEMTSVEGIAMGSNNIDLFDPKMSLTRLIKYEKPAVYLGFRCIAEIDQ